MVIVAQPGCPGYSPAMVGDAVSVIQRIVIVIVAVVLIGFGTTQMMNDRSRQGLRPHLINLHGIDSPAFPDYEQPPTRPVQMPLVPERVADDYRARYQHSPIAEKPNMRSAQRQRDPLSYERMDIDDLLKP